MAAQCLGPYRLDAELGSGGMGTVWRAELTRRAAGVDAGAIVALKLVHPHLLETEGFFRRFLREAEIGRRVVHENVVRTFDCDQLAVDGRAQCFLVMEYVEGQTLRGLLDDLGRVPEELCRHIGREVAKGLAAIHAAGAVHRDVKPENVLITKQHVVKVMDLGVARLADEAARLSQSGAFVGSIRYAAPEQFAKGGADVDGRADLHALGLVLYELATAQHPYDADDFRAVMRRVLDEQPRRCAEINPQLSPFFEEFVLQLLAKDREQRFADAATVASILGEGEASAWWKARENVIRVETKRPLRRIRIPRETALHGRDAELARLRALFDAAKSGEGRVVLVEGEAGIGKSRLVDEFVGRLRQSGEDLNFLFGSYPPGGAATASGAFSTAYREHFGESGSAGYLAQTPILVPAFDALLRGESTPAGVEPLTKDSLQTVFVHATRALAAERTTIVLIDDLHFAPEEGRALFAALAMAVPGHRVLLVGTARPGLDETWLAHMDRVGAARLPLPRLGPKDLVRMLADAFRSERLAEELGARIALKSDGNPFFVFEILRGLRDGQFLTRREDGTWATTRVIEDIQIPSSVLELVQARVADLDRDERNALDVASCLGFEFDPSLVASVLGVGRIPLLQSLAHVEKAHRLVRSAGRRFVFDHHQVQEALYAGLPQMLREEYHAAIGAALEARDRADTTDVKDLDGAMCVDLAEHFLKGALGRRATRYLDAAMSHLERGYLNDAAIRLADAALAVDGLVAGADRCDLLLRKVTRLEILGRHDAEFAALAEALVLADASGGPARRARARNGLSSHFIRVARRADAETAIGEALDIARTHGDLRAEAAATANLGNLLTFEGRHAEARAQYARCIELAQAIGDARMEAVAVGNLAGPMAAIGDLAGALAEGERHLALARRVGDRREEARAIGNIGNSLSRLARHDEARARYERHLALSREIGFRRGECVATAGLALIRIDCGELADARTLRERQLELARELGDRKSETTAIGSLGRIAHLLGDLDAARRNLGEALRIAKEIGARGWEAAEMETLGEVAADAGDADEAVRLLDGSLALRTRDSPADTIVRALIALGDLRHRARDTAGARARFDEALAVANARGLPTFALLCRALIATLPGGDAAVAAALANAEASVFDLRIRFVLWQSSRDRAHLAAAKRILDHLLAHAPPECREPMLTNVGLYREVAAASKEQGLGDPPPDA